MDDASEEDDSSWKVRRASIRCLSAFIRTKADILQNYYETILSTLISRMKERDHNVKVRQLRADKVIKIPPFIQIGTFYRNFIRLSLILTHFWLFLSLLLVFFSFSFSLLLLFFSPFSSMMCFNVPLIYYVRV